MLGGVPGGEGVRADGGLGEEEPHRPWARATTRCDGVRVCEYNCHDEKAAFGPI